jgi:hypothetical protein
MTNPLPASGKLTVGRWFAAWLVMLLISVANGAVRDLTYGTMMTERTAHQLSTLSGMVLLGGVIRSFVHRFPPTSVGHALGVGGLWMGLTVAFELLFFHFVGHRSWPSLLADYNLPAGRLWPLLLLWIALAPALLYRSPARGKPRP